MELKEYFLIIKKHLKLFGTISAIVIFGALAYFIFRPAAFNVSLTLNITRLGTQNSDSYKYDDFYRLQADEKFAETVVEWLKSPRIEEDIYTNSGVNTTDYSLKRLSGGIVAEKRSSQIVAVSFSAPNQKMAQSIALSVSKIISQNIQSLNQDQKETVWFEISSAEPVIRPNEINPFVVPIVFLGAIFLAFFGVLFKHYLE